MKINLYALKDCKIGFRNPFNMPNDESAKRIIRIAVNNKIDENNNEIRKFADDIELWKVGEYDDQTGEIKSTIKFLARAIDYKTE